MILTAEQQELVTENHNLIYWYAHKMNLELEEWYGALAIELCNTAMKYNPSKSSFSNYFKLTADGMLNRERAKNMTSKRTHNGIYELNDLNHPDNLNSLETEVIIKQFLDEDDTGILELKALGYTQLEIAEKLDISQASVSRELNRLKEKYYAD